MKLATLSLVLLAACGAKARPATPVDNQAAGATASIRSVDWQNRTYDLGGDGKYTVKDGSYEFAYDENGNEVAGDYQPSDPDVFVERGEFSVSTPVYGDLDGDGAEEAVIITYFNGGGTGRFTGITVFSMKDGQPVELGGVPGGDRGDGGVADVKLDGDVVLVDRLMSMEDDGACCPSKIQHERWRWNGTAFAEDEAARTMSDNSDPM